jgi:hypothetical protein
MASTFSGKCWRWPKGSGGEENMKEKSVKRPMRSGVWLVAALAVMATLTGARSAAPVYQWALADSAAAVALPPPVTSLAPFNNEGISPDSDPAVGNFDGGGRSYSSNALTAAGFSTGASVTVGSYVFQWATPAVGRVDNWEPTEQTIPFSTTATSIASGRTAMATKL